MAAPLSAAGRVRIGELSRRTGVTVDVLRVWERRYGLLSPERTDGGQRLYAQDDERRVRAMVERLREGLTAAEAARTVTTVEPAAPTTPDELAAPLVEALDGLDEAAAHAALDRLFAGLGMERTLTDVLMPYLYELGERWAAGRISPADEHFASRLLHGRLLAAARGWDTGAGPRAVLACPPGEDHDLPLVSFGLALRRQGWRIVYLGANTPIAPIARMARSVEAEAVVLAATAASRFADVLGQLQDLANEVPVALAGAGAHPQIAAKAGAHLLEGDPVAGAREVARGLERRS